MLVTPPVFGAALSLITQRIIPHIGREIKHLSAGRGILALVVRGGHPALEVRVNHRWQACGLRFYLMGWFLVDNLAAGGLDDWEVKIADFVPSTAKPATRQVFCWGKMRKRF